MAIYPLPLWEVVLDGIQFFLCGGILLFLICNKIKYKRMILNISPKDYSTVITNEMRIQTLKYQTEQTFNTILNVIHQERRTLQNYYDIEERKKGIPKEMDNGKILMLAKKGLTAKEISRSVHRPRGEVELILMLNKISGGDINSNTIRAQDRA